MRFMITGEYNKNQLQRMIMIAFLVYIGIHWLSSTLLFYFKLGFSYQSVVEYYLGSEEKFLQPRTFMGLLEVTHFHLFSTGLILLTLTHLLLSVQIKPRVRSWLSIGSFGLGLADILSGWLIRYIHPGFAYLKISAFFLFQGVLIIILLYSYIRTKKKS